MQRAPRRKVEPRQHTRNRRRAAMATVFNTELGRRDILKLSAALAGTAPFASALPVLDAFAADKPVFVTGHYKPTQQELTVSQLRVRGSIPPELAGRYIRNGHNPKPGLVPPYWFEGHGMLHGVRIK